MNFKPSETTQQVADAARDFAEHHIRPYVMEWDESQYFPKETLKQMGALGLLGMFIPSQYGGSGFGYHEYAAAIVELGKVCGSVALSMAAHNSLCTGHIYYCGSEAQKQRWLPKLASGDWIGAWGLTEPNTGSDAGNMKTTAVREGDEWVLNGTKCWITHGISAEVALVIARTGAPRSSGNATAFVVERGTPGFYAGKKENKLGMRASETAEMIFENCRIPDANRIGEVRDGFRQAMKVLDGGRISIAALSLGIAKGAYEAALKYAQERQQFDQPIAHFQGISFKLADMATEIAAAELLIAKAASLKDARQQALRFSANNIFLVAKAHKGHN
jgi:alkylation response protein AidB-like acyl-CoA dehydrogenase